MCVPVHERAPYRARLQGLAGIRNTTSWEDAPDTKNLLLPDLMNKKARRDTASPSTLPKTPAPHTPISQPHKPTPSPLSSSFKTRPTKGAVSTVLNEHLPKSGAESQPASVKVLAPKLPQPYRQAFRFELRQAWPLPAASSA